MNTRQVSLLQLAVQILLRHKALSITILDDLPVELFPLLFREAYLGGHYEMLWLLVKCWPFSRLPLGALMRIQHLGIFYAALDGLEALSEKRNRPRRWKLQVLDFSIRSQNSWDVWSGHTNYDYLPRARNIHRPRRSGRRRTTPCLKVVEDLCIPYTHDDPNTFCMPEWTSQFRIKLGCIRMHVSTYPFFLLKMLFKTWSLSDIQELKVHCTNSEATIDTVFSHVGQMRNLQELFLCDITDRGSLLGREKVVLKLCKKIKKLKFLQKLYISNTFFLKNNMSHICRLDITVWFLLRSLNTPLEVLSISESELTESDWENLNSKLNASKLENLSVCYVDLSSFNFLLLQTLLNQVTNTLTTLKLEVCQITDSHIDDILPALSHCWQLTTISFYGNTFSTTVLKNLLLATANMSQLCLELYPAPRESYYADGILKITTITQLFPQLKSHLRAIRQPKNALLLTKPCDICRKELIYHL
ncbi:PRAME family member 20-like [Perognathus longimembris pacificus]|uniref:PRAME family member 20-like n=1 Tax=Perognathus longimembris pacificus TaxID=214514 RepID=UPI00201A1DB3|nr:PRAME family member 20-like [Perognathus longimembris pacificus]